MMIIIPGGAITVEVEEGVRTGCTSSVESPAVETCRRFRQQGRQRDEKLHSHGDRNLGVLVIRPDRPLSRDLLNPTKSSLPLPPLFRRGGVGER
jgi:hypothetical protein